MPMVTIQFGARPQAALMALALQLPCFFTVRALSDRLVSSAPE